MVWQDIYINRKLNKDEIIYALTSIFKVLPTNILITKNIDDIVLDNDIKVLCQTYKIDAEFELMLSIYIRDNTLIPDNDVEAISKFCEILNCEVMISDDSLNPYIMRQIKDSSNIKLVSIDITKYDNALEYEVD